MGVESRLEYDSKSYIEQTFPFKFHTSPPPPSLSEYDSHLMILDDPIQNLSLLYLRAYNQIDEVDSICHTSHEFTPGKQDKNLF